MRFLITRPKPDALALESQLNSLQHQAIISPVIDVVCRETPLPDPVRFDAMVITSRNALRCLARKDGLSPFKNRPVFAVGQASAKLATEMGFRHIIEGKGRASDLSAIIAAHFQHDAKPRLFHPGGEKKAFDLAASLAKQAIGLSELVVYETRLCSDLIPAATQAIRSNRLDGVFLMSPRTARHFHVLIKKNRLEQAMKAVSCLCLSQKVAQALTDMPCRDLRVAAHPNMKEIIALI